MRSLVADSTYFRFLDGLRDTGVATTLAPMLLMQEFPTLRAEEAKAVCADWRLRCRRRWAASNPADAKRLRKLDGGASGKGKGERFAS